MIDQYVVPGFRGDDYEEPDVELTDEKRAEMAALDALVPEVDW